MIIKNPLVVITGIGISDEDIEKIKKQNDKYSSLLGITKDDITKIGNKLYVVRTGDNIEKINNTINLGVANVI